MSDYSKPQGGIFSPNIQRTTVDQVEDTVSQSDEFPEILANNNETGDNQIVLDTQASSTSGVIVVKDPNTPNGIGISSWILQLEDYPDTGIKVGHGDPLGSQGSINIEGRVLASLKHAASGNGFSAGLVQSSVAGDLVLNDDFLLVGSGSGGDLIRFTATPTDPNRVQTFQDKSGVIALQDDNGTIEIGGGLIFDGSETVTINADTDNLVVPNLEKTVLIRLDVTGNYSLTGLVPSDITKSQMIIIENVGTSTLSLKDNDIASTAQNRFLLGGNLTIQSDEGIILVYDNVDTRWRSAAKNI